MSPRKSARLAFMSALVLLLLSGIAASVAISRFSENSQWVFQTYELQVATGEVGSTLSEAARARANYVNTRDRTYLLQYEKAKQETSISLLRVRELAAENLPQQALFKKLEELANQRIGLLQTSIDIRDTGRPDEAQQTAITLQSTKFATDAATVVDQMQRQEETLLQSRKNATGRLFAIVLWIFGAMLAGALLLFWIHYRLLNQELGKREMAEGGARRLSAHVLQLQDEERRKFSRELHDGLGQNLAVAKMIASGLLDKNPNDETVQDLLHMLDQSISETRTISHLLHPLLLDELGLASAVSWYVEGFSQRSGLQISTKIEDKVGRLPRPLELVLFRVLQESLANVHRHAKSPRAEVSLRTLDGLAVLHVRDYGTGIPAEKLKHFRSDGTQVGVGLTGMRERVREHGGQFEIYSDAKGTEVLVSIPLDTPANMQDGTPIARSAG